MKIKLKNYLQKESGTVNICMLTINMIEWRYFELINEMGEGGSSLTLVLITSKRRNRRIRNYISADIIQICESVNH